MKPTDIIKYVVALGLLCLVVIFTVFYRLDANPLFIWDEARVAVSALEMSQSHHYFIPTYEGKPDMWSVKPPLMVIIQSFSMDVFGYNELGARMPTALAAVGTVLLLLWFSIRILKDLAAGFCAVIFLCTSGGYICMHVARSGDYDTLLIFFLTGFFLSGVAFVIRQQYKFYVLLNVFLLLALFTKGIAGMFFAPGIFFFIVLQKGMFKRLLQLKFILPPILVLVSIGGYYLLREQYNPGYIHTVVYEELQGRMADTHFNLNRPWYFFFENMVSSTFSPWWILALLTIPYYFIANNAERKLILATWLTVVIFWIPLIVTVNKNFWYNAPAYPLLSLMAAVVFSAIFKFFTQPITKDYARDVLFLLVVLLFTTPVFYRIFSTEVCSDDRRGLAELIKSGKIVQHAQLVSKDYNPTALFYQKALRIKGVDVDISNADVVKSGDVIIATNKEDANEIKGRFQHNTLYSFLETEMFQLKDKN
jgi:4-amino-4-deoxy-L-arabinose transferase-like glycosyltransferase